MPGKIQHSLKEFDKNPDSYCKVHNVWHPKTKINIHIKEENVINNQEKICQMKQTQEMVVLSKLIQHSPY